MAATEVGESLAGRKRWKNAEVAQLVEQPIRKAFLPYHDPQKH